MDKRGQFYIIAAVIIVVAISSIASISTYIAVKPEPKVMKELGDNLKEESVRIIDYGIYNGKNLTSLENNFTEADFSSYVLQKTNNANITFIYGNRGYLKMIQYSMPSSGEVCIGTSCLDSVIINANKEVIVVSPTQDSVEVRLLNRDYSFKLRESEMFYFVITKQNEGEIYVETNS